ncbi:reverse transcriptase [Trichonephila clavipes]|nr:reverse transcriptase [Trichonephila clavipes]
MITNFFIPELNNHDVQELWFQQGCATCHTARATIDLLKDTFGDRLISRFGPVNWPPRSCDLTPLDYFLHLERTEAVILFHLTIGHDVLGVYLHWLVLYADEACLLCGHARMDSDLLLQCTGLVNYPIDDILSRYWEAWSQMVKKSNMDIR